jgi:Ala-tRNA(Pro) deacylase
MEQQEKVFCKLNELNISYEVVNHPAAFTVEEIDALGFDAHDDVAKNLFLRDDRGKNHYLVVVQKHKKVDLKKLREQLGSTKLGFASEERLWKYLKLTKGSVTPLGVINDDTCSVVVVFDKDLVHSKKIGVHPNENTSTVFMSFDDLKQVIESSGNKIIYAEV